jgi:hypothetical protein
MPLTQFIYTSTPFGYDDATLSGILISARHFNRRDGITGALICREDIFLQLLEGPAEAVSAAFARIARDGRHIEVTLLQSGHVEERLFPQWDMQHDPARSWIWTPQQVEEGVVRKVPGHDLRAIFTRVATEANDSARRL